MFNFLKNESYKNILTEWEYKEIWLPHYQFGILKDISLVQYKKKITVKRDGEPQTKDTIRPIERYSGAESIIQIKTTIQENFI